MDSKKIVAKEVLKMIEREELIGLGTGSTVMELVKLMNEFNMIKGKKFICSSLETEEAVSKMGGLVLSPFSINGVIDLYIDSFDEIDDELNLLKGGGGAFLREKVLAFNSKKRIFIGEKSKEVKRLSSNFPIPIEVVPFSLPFIIPSLSSSFSVKIRKGNLKRGPVISDNGNIIIDAIPLKKDLDPCRLDLHLKAIPGVVETGIFCNNLVDLVLIADTSGIIREIRR